jgi:hypothetical protein
VSSDENKMHRDSAAGARARNLLDNDLLTEAFKSLEESYAKGWRESDPLDTAAREKLYLAINIVGKVRDHLQKAVTNGKFAQDELKSLADQAAHKSLFGVRRYSSAQYT